MAIKSRKRRDGSFGYQVKVRGTDGRWITDTFDRRTDAERFEAEVKLKKLRGHSVIGAELTVIQFWDEWRHAGRTRVSAGWKMSQDQMFKDYISPVIGSQKLGAINPALITKV